MGKKLILMSSLNLFSFSSCLLSHPPAVQPCEKSGFTFLVISLQALKDAVKPIPKPCPLQAATAQFVQPLLRGQVWQPLISWSSSAEVISISPCLNQNCYCFCSQVLCTFMAFWLLLGTTGRKMAQMKGCNLMSSHLLSLCRSPTGNSFVLWPHWGTGLHVFMEIPCSSRFIALTGTALGIRICHSL